MVFEAPEQGLRQLFHQRGGTGGTSSLSPAEFDERADHLKATKAVDVARMRRVVGIAKDELAGKTAQEWMNELRGPVDLPQAKRRK